MRVAVLGAGLQGACIALELASKDVQVDLYDKNDTLISQASAKSEAKIHLGYLYGNDSSLKTARLLIRGALTFAPLLRRWIGTDIDEVPVSSPYYYLVPQTSLLSVERIEQHFHACSALLQEQPATKDDYFGVDYTMIPTRLSASQDLFQPEIVAGAFETPEIAISAETLATYLRERVSGAANVRCVMGAIVRSVSMNDSQGLVEFEIDGDRYEEGYDHIVNALWDGRLAIDATAGFPPERPWLFRMKYNLHIPQAPFHPGVPSVSMTLGPYGDLVQYSNGEMYLSWYPASLKAMSSDLEPPDWPRSLQGEEATKLGASIVESIGHYVPALADLAPHTLPGTELLGGVIFAWGSTDVDDPRSELHSRYDIGPTSFGRYHSVNTGKLTTAPLFAVMTADHILGS